MSLKELIDKNKLDWVNSDITDKNFPLPKRNNTDYKLFHFDRNITSEEIVAEMEKEDYCPANIAELLNWKDWNSKDCIVALGSSAIVNRVLRVPVLGGVIVKRGLSLVCWEGGWVSNYRFLAVRKYSTQPSDTSALELRVLALEKFVDKLKNTEEVEELTVEEISKRLGKTIKVVK